MQKVLACKLKLSKLMKAIFQAVSLQLLSMKHRNSYFSLGIMLFVFIVGCIILFIEDFKVENFHSLQKIFNQAFIMAPILIFSTPTESGLLKKWKSLGLNREEIFHKLILKVIIVSSIYYLLYMFFNFIYYLLKPGIYPYMQYLFEAKIILTILSTSLFLLLFCLFTRKLGNSLALAYFVLPILFQLIFYFFGKILQFDWFIALSPLGIMYELLTNNLFIDNWIVYLSLGCQIFIFTFLINWRVKKMDL